LYTPNELIAGEIAMNRKPWSVPVFSVFFSGPNSAAGDLISAVPPAPTFERGFTLVELIVVMVMVGILAVAVIPKFDSLQDFDGFAYRDKVRAALEYARKSAVAQRRTVTVSLGSNNLSLTIAKAPADEPSAGTDTQPLNLPARDANCSADNQVCIRSPSTVTLTSSATVPLQFDAQGSPGSSTITYTVGPSIGTVTVEAHTGYVH
jgi:MSHA pilin protein MshC